jgi:photosystem II stability/assembly factor-like uncharacterized protein
MFSRKEFLVSLRVVSVAGFLLMGVWQSASYAGWTQITIPGTSSQYNNVGVAASILFFSAQEDSLVFRSTDNGVTWQRVTGMKWFTKIKGNSSKLFAIAASYYSGTLFSSSDKGISWAKVNSIDSTFNSGIYDLSVQDNKILTVVNSRLLLSVNNGQSWEILNSSANNLTQGIYSICIMGNNLYQVGFGGITASTNLGHSWFEANYGLFYQKYINRISSTGNYLYANLTSQMEIPALYCSTDSGYTWNSMGLTGFSTTEINFSKTTAFVGKDGGIYAAPLDSANWTNIGLPPKQSLVSLATDTGFLYAYTGYMDTISQSTIRSLYRRPLSEVNSLLKMAVTGPQASSSDNFVINHFSSQHAIGITFSPGRTEKASLRVYAATGKTITTLFDGTIQGRDNKFIWDYKNIPSGIYCISLQSENGKAVKKVQVMR